MDVKKRQAIERKIVRAVVRSAIKEGYTFGVINGGDAEIRTTTERKTLAEMFATDQDRLCLYRGNLYVGWVLFVYGNDGWDVVADYTINLEPIMSDAVALADKYQ